MARQTFENVQHKTRYLELFYFKSLCKCCKPIDMWGTFEIFSRSLKNVFTLEPRFLNFQIFPKCRCIRENLQIFEFYAALELFVSLERCMPQQIGQHKSAIVCINTATCTLCWSVCNQYGLHSSQTVQARDQQFTLQPFHFSWQSGQLYHPAFKASLFQALLVRAWNKEPLNARRYREEVLVETVKPIEGQTFF